MTRLLSALGLLLTLFACSTPPANPAPFRIAPRRPVDELRAEALAASPPVEKEDFLPSDLVSLEGFVPDLALDIRYATANNFLGTPVYRRAAAFLQRPAAEALARTARNLHEEGYGLIVFDAYRPWHVTKIFWDATPDAYRDFVSNPARGSRHNRGCAVDLGLYDLATGQPIEMPTDFDDFSPRAHSEATDVAPEARRHRDLLRAAMEAEGFTVLKNEWWHFDFRDWRRYRLGNTPLTEL